MFFIFGLSSKQKRINYKETSLCPSCGQYGQYEIIMEYMYFSLFFIPILKWNKKYYVVSSCCHSIFTISKEIGNKIARGYDVNLTEVDFELIERGHRLIECSNCGYKTSEDFQYCPKCATEFNHSKDSR